MDLEENIKLNWAHRLLRKLPSPIKKGLLTTIALPFILGEPSFAVNIPGPSLAQIVKTSIDNTFNHKIYKNKHKIREIAKQVYWAAAYEKRAGHEVRFPAFREENNNGGRVSAFLDPDIYAEIPDEISPWRSENPIQEKIAEFLETKLNANALYFYDEPYKEWIAYNPETGTRYVHNYKMKPSGDEIVNRSYPAEHTFILEDGTHIRFTFGFDIGPERHVPLFTHAVKKGKKKPIGQFTSIGEELIFDGRDVEIPRNEYSPYRLQPKKTNNETFNAWQEKLEKAYYGKDMYLPWIVSVVAWPDDYVPFYPPEPLSPPTTPMTTTPQQPRKKNVAIRALIQEERRKKKKAKKDLFDEWEKQMHEYDEAEVPDNKRMLTISEEFTYMTRRGIDRYNDLVQKNEKYKNAIPKRADKAIKRLELLLAENNFLPASFSQIALGPGEGAFEKRLYDASIANGSSIKNVIAVEKESYGLKDIKENFDVDIDDRSGDITDLSDMIETRKKADRTAVYTLKEVDINFDEKKLHQLYATLQQAMRPGDILIRTQPIWNDRHTDAYDDHPDLYEPLERMDLNRKDWDYEIIKDKENKEFKIVFKSNKACCVEEGGRMMILPKGFTIRELLSRRDLISGKLDEYGFTHTQTIIDDPTDPGYVVDVLTYTPEETQFISLDNIEETDRAA